MSASLQSWGQLVSNLGLSCAILVPLWTVLGPPSSILGPTWANQAPHGAGLRRLEPQVRPYCGYLGRIGAILAPLWALMKPSWRQLGPTRPGLYRILIGLGRSWPGFEPNLAIGNMTIIVVPLDFVGFMYVWEMSVFMQSWGQLVPNLGLSCAILVLLRNVLGPTSSILAPHGASLSRFEPQVRPSGGYFGTSGATLEPAWGNQAPHGANQPRYGNNLAPAWGQFGSTWSCFEPSCPQFSVDLGLH